MDDFSRLSALQQADLVRRREVRPIDLVEAAVGRIEALNPRLNAVVRPMYEEARRDAASVDLDASLAGVPFLVKDLGVDCDGLPTTRGSAYFAAVTPAADSELTSRYRRAGLIIMGKTNTPELGLLPTTEPRLFGPTRNPWDLGRTPGGSSGGSAAAVAAGLVAVAHGNDGAGSLRIPASCCGVFALKPSRGRMPGRGSVADFLGVQGVLTAGVRDTAALLDATAGAQPGAAYSLPAPPRPFLAETELPSERLRIAFSTGTVAGLPLHADCRAAVLDAAELCRSLGHEIYEDSAGIDGEEFIASFLTVWAARTAAGLETAITAIGRRPRADELEPATWQLYEAGLALKATDYLAAFDAFDRMTEATAHLFERCDVWLTSTLGFPPPPLGYLAAAGEMWSGRRAFEFVPNTPLFNLTGQPAVSVPLYWNEAGLPIGVHFAARPAQEATLLRLAVQLEEARPWAERRPPL